MRQVRLILSGLSGVIILLSINRLTQLTQGLLSPAQFLRWQDFNAMLPLPLLTTILYLVLWWGVVGVEKTVQTNRIKWLLVLFASGIYFFGASSGTHEVTNYLNHRYCITSQIDATLCQIVGYNDDVFSHYIYYLGLVIMNVVLMLSEYLYPRKDSMEKSDLWIVSANALFIATGIVANLAFEEIGIDLAVFAALMGVSLYLLWQRRRVYRQVPIIYYSALAYTVGVVVTLVIQTL